MKVIDKRHFNPDGSAKEGTAQAEDSEDQATKGNPNEAAKEPVQETEEEEHRTFPEINFEAFIISLATSAQVHLGLIPNPGTGEQEKNLALAKQTIDIITLIEKKTEGNLNEGEKELMEKILYDLRMIYVEVSKL